MSMKLLTLTKNNQVTRRNLSEKASMAGSESTPRCCLKKVLRKTSEDTAQNRNMKNGSTARQTLHF